MLLGCCWAVRWQYKPTPHPRRFPHPSPCKPPRHWRVNHHVFILSSPGPIQSRAALVPHTSYEMAMRRIAAISSFVHCACHAAQLVPRCGRVAVAGVSGVRPASTDVAANADQPVWTAVDKYFEDTLLRDTTQDPALTAAVTGTEAAGLPAHAVSATQGKLLHLLTRIAGAVRVLEVGTLGGYSTIWFGRAVAEQPGGHVLSLEVSPAAVEVASASIERAGLGDTVTIRGGPAAESMRQLIQHGSDPFDLVFIDADKPSNPEYLQLAMQLVRPGSVIVGDNVVRNGAVMDGTSEDGNVQGVRTFMDMMAAHDRLDATAVQTVGCKGYDGFSIAVVK